MNVVWISLMCILFIYPSIAQDTGDQVTLSSVGAYRTTFDKINYDKVGKMKMGNVEYEKGLQLNSNGIGNTREDNAYFNLDKKYNHLSGLVGLDDRSYLKGKVVLSFIGDDKEIKKITLVPADLPINIDIDVSNVRRLTINSVVSHSSGYYDGALYLDMPDMILWNSPPITAITSNIVVPSNYTPAPAPSSSVQANSPPVISNLVADAPGIGTNVGGYSTASNQAVTWIATASDPDGDPVLYRFFLNGLSTGGSWQPVTYWATDNRWIGTISFADTSVGNITLYQVEVQVRDGKHSGPGSFDDSKTMRWMVL